MKNTVLLKRGKKKIIFNSDSLLGVIVDSEAEKVYKNFINNRRLNKKEKKFIESIKVDLSSKKPKEVSGNPIIDSFRIALTEKCNLNCKYCFVKKNKKILKEMSEQTLKKFIKNSYLSKKRKYHFFGGEPLLKFDLIELAVHLTKQNKTNYSITTNGMLITEDIAKFFKKYDFEVGVSIDGQEKENEKLRVGNSSFSKSIRGYKLLEKFDVRRFVLITPYPENKNSFFETIMFFIKKLNVKKIVINTPFDKNFGWMINGKDFANIIVKSIKMCDKYNIELDSSANPIMYSIINNVSRKSPCFYSGKNIMSSVSPMGEISYCSQKWGEEGLGKISSIQKTNACKNCFAKNICGGPCPIYQKLSKKPLDKNKCDFQKEFLTQYLLDKEL